MDQKLELLATLLVAVGGTIGGALLALRKAIKTNGSNGGSTPQRGLASLSDQIHSLETKMVESEARVMQRIADNEAKVIERTNSVDRRLIRLEARFEFLPREGGNE